MFSESELIKGCLDKQKKTWDIFVQKYSKLIYWAIRKRLAHSGFQFNQDDVGEIFQEVFLSILNSDKLRQIKNPKTITGWLVVISSNKAVDFMRGKIRRDQRIAINDSEGKDDNLRQELCRRDLALLIDSIVNNLSDKERIIINFNLFEGRTHKEISGIMHIPINTVSTVISRTKQKLKQALERKGMNNL